MGDTTEYKGGSVLVRTDEKATEADIFKANLISRKESFQQKLPSDVPVDAFLNAALVAYSQSADLKKATQRSLFTALLNAATDGLKPDGKEGVITVFNTKKKDRSGREVWVQEATWLPMAHGIRKRMRELEGIMVTTKVICENDEFDWEEGDNERIEHRPKLNKRGAVAGAYAIFKKGGEILHREVMGLDDIEAVRKKSRSPNGLMWKDFYGEAARKSVLHRGAKSVPLVSPAMQQIMTREHAAFDFGQKPAADLTLRQDDYAALPAPAEDGGHNPETGDLDDMPEPFDAELYLAGLSSSFDACQDIDALAKVWTDAFADMAYLQVDIDVRKRARALYEAAQARVNGPAAEEAEAASASQIRYTGVAVSALQEAQTLQDVDAVLKRCENAVRTAQSVTKAAGAARARIAADDDRFPGDQ